MGFGPKIWWGWSNQPRRQTKTQKYFDALEKSHKIGLPKLEGTLKQVEWAMVIRQKVYDAWIEVFKLKLKEEELLLLKKVFSVELSAKWWIEHRSLLPDRIIEKLKSKMNTAD